MICIIFANVYRERIMSSKLGFVWNILARYKYLITVVVGVAVVGFIDDNSFLRRIQYDLQISQLKDEIKKYNAQNEQATNALRELRRTPKAIERIARERYFMKADDEDIYVLSTDVQPAGEDQNQPIESNEAIK